MSSEAFCTKCGKPVESKCEVCPHCGSPRFSVEGTSQLPNSTRMTPEGSPSLETRKALRSALSPKAWSRQIAKRPCSICYGVIGQCGHSFTERWAKGAGERKKQREHHDAKLKAIGEDVKNVVKTVASVVGVIVMIMIWRSCTSMPDTPDNSFATRTDTIQDTGYIGCLEKEELEKLSHLAFEHDDKAFGTEFDMAIATGQCISLAKGTHIYFEGGGFVSGLEGLEQVRPEGSTTAYWINAKAVEATKHWQDSAISSVIDGGYQNACAR